MGAYTRLKDNPIASHAVNRLDLWFLNSFIVLLVVTLMNSIQWEIRKHRDSKEIKYIFWLQWKVAIISLGWWFVAPHTQLSPQRPWTFCCPSALFKHLAQLRSCPGVFLWQKGICAVIHLSGKEWLNLLCLWWMENRRSGRPAPQGKHSRENIYNSNKKEEVMDLRGSGGGGRREVRGEKVGTI